MLEVEGKALEVQHWLHPAATGTILLIHEALGSVSYWKDFPELLASLTGYSTVAYSRAGHGNSQGPLEPRSLDYYRRQVEVVLPAILNHFSIDAPVLYGHSEGAGIAMLYAAHPQPGRPHPVRAIIAEAPIVSPEESTTATIRQLGSNYATSDLSRRLGRYHADPDAVFHSWIQSNRASFSKEYPLERFLPRITCPILVMQGDHDEFGGVRQFEVIQQALPHARHRVFDSGHLLHREQPRLIAEAAAVFLEGLPPMRP